MKFWMVFVALLFVAPTLHAQNSLYGYPYNPYTQPYYPCYLGEYNSPPYCPRAYYPQLSSQLPNESFQVYDYTTINALTRQVQQLSDQVLQLQAQIALAQAQPPQPSPAEAITRTPGPPETPMTFVFKNGRQVSAQGYAIAGQTLWILTPSGYESTALSDLDIAVTKSENLKRGINFEIPVS